VFEALLCSSYGVISCNQVLHQEWLLGSNGIGEKSPVDAAGRSAAGERIPGRDDGPSTAAKLLKSSGTELSSSGM
jgi:hypothetical protein